MSNKQSNQFCADISGFLFMLFGKDHLRVKIRVVFAN